MRDPVSGSGRRSQGLMRNSARQLLDDRLAVFGQGLAAQVHPGIGLWDPESQRPTPTDHYGQLACALALLLLEAPEQAREAEQAWYALRPQQRGHAPFNRFLLVLASRVDLQCSLAVHGRLPEALGLCPIKRRYPSNNWTVLAQLCRVLEAPPGLPRQRADRRLRQLLETWMSPSGGFIDAPRHRRMGPMATPMAYHHKALFVATVAAWQTGNREWTAILEPLLRWTLLSWDGAGCVGGFGRSNHALFGDACLVASLILLGACEQAPHNSLPAQMLIGILNRWQSQLRLDGLLWLNPAGTLEQPRKACDNYTHLSVYNAWTAAILAWALQITHTSERPQAITQVNHPSMNTALLQDPDAGLLRVGSPDGMLVLASSRGQPPQAFSRTEIDFRYGGAIPFHLITDGQQRIPPPIRINVQALLDQPALAGWSPVFEVSGRLYGLTLFNSVKLQESHRHRIKLDCSGLAVALTRPSSHGVIERAIASLDWRLLGGAFGRRQVHRRATLAGVAGTIKLEYDLQARTLDYHLILEKSSEQNVRYLNPAGHAIIGSTNSVQRQASALGQDQTGQLFAQPLPAALPNATGYSLAPRPLATGRSVYAIRLSW